MNRFSRAREYSKPTSPFDMNFIGQAMAYKQSRVDANKALIQDTIDNIMSLTIDKPEARDYLYGRVEQMVNSVNAYSGSDLSNDNVARNISAYINNAMDETVLNAYAGTMEGRKMEQYYDQLMRDDPDRYNERNKAFAMDPYYQWLRDGKAGSRLAPLQVSNYVDYSKEAQDVLKQMREAQKNGMEWQYPDPDNPGYMVTKKIDKMTSDEVQQAITNSLSPGAKKQMLVDGWYMANTQPDAFTPEALSQYVSSVNSDYDRDKAALRAQMAGSVGDPARYDELRRSYDILDEKRTSFNNTARQIFSTGNIEQMGTFMVENNFLRGMGQTWAYDKSSIKMENDPSYWSKKNYERGVAKDQADAAYRLEDLALKREELTLSMALKKSQIDLNQAKAMNLMNGNSGESSGNYSGVGVSVNTPMTTSGDLLPADKRVGAEIKTSLSERDNSVVGLRNSLSDKARADIDSWISKVKQESPDEYYGLSDNEMFIKYFDENGGFANEYLQGNNSMLYLQEAKKFSRDLDIPMKVANEYRDYQRQTANDYVSKAEELLKGDLKDELIVDRSGNFVRAGEVGDLPSGAYLANILAGDFMTNVLESSTLPSVTGTSLALPNGGVAYKISAEKVNSPSMISYLKEISELVGEDVSVEDVFVLNKTGEYYEVSDSDSYTATMFRTIINKSYRGRPGVTAFANDPLIENSEARTIAKSINNPSMFEEISQKYINTIVTPMGKVVSEKAPQKSAERTFYLKLYELYSGMSDPDLIKEMEDNKNKTAVLTSVVDPNTNTTTYGIYMNGDPSNMVAVDKGTLLRNGIDVDASRDIPIEKMSPRYNSVKLASSTNDMYAEFVQGLTGSTGFASKTELQNTLLDEYPELFTVATEQGLAATQFGQEAINMASNIDKLGVEVQGYSNGGKKGVKVLLYDNRKDESSRTPIYSYTLPGVSSASTVQDWLDACPQYFVLQALRNSLNEYQAGLKRGNTSAKSSWNSIYGTVMKGNNNAGQ